MKNLLLILVVLLFLSCKKTSDDNNIKQATGTVWISGGLVYCAEQIHLDNGKKLIVSDKITIYKFRAGDRVVVKYKEIGTSKYCAPNIDCNVISMEKLQ